MLSFYANSACIQEFNNQIEDLALTYLHLPAWALFFTESTYRPLMLHTSTLIHHTSPSVSAGAEKVDNDVRRQVM
jgi:hypothetical protein